MVVGGQNKTLTEQDNGVFYSTTNANFDSKTEAFLLHYCLCYLRWPLPYRIPNHPLNKYTS